MKYVISIALCLYLLVSSLHRYGSVSIGNQTDPRSGCLIVVLRCHLNASVANSDIYLLPDMQAMFDLVRRKGPQQGLQYQTAHM